MKCTVLGKKKVEFVEKETGELKQFAKVFVAHRVPADNQATTFEGRGCSVVSVPFEYYPQILVDSNIDLDFDTDGKLLEIILED